MRFIVILEPQGSKGSGMINFAGPHIFPENNYILKNGPKNAFHPIGFTFGQSFL